jgi:hypothetical protein
MFGPLQAMAVAFGDQALIGPVPETLEPPISTSATTISHRTPLGDEPTIEFDPTTHESLSPSAQPVPDETTERRRGDALDLEGASPSPHFSSLQPLEPFGRRPAIADTSDWSTGSTAQHGSLEDGMAPVGTPATGSEDPFNLPFFPLSNPNHAPVLQAVYRYGEGALGRLYVEGILPAASGPGEAVTIDLFGSGRRLGSTQVKPSSLDSSRFQTVLKADVENGEAVTAAVGGSASAPVFVETGPDTDQDGVPNWVESLAPPSAANHGGTAASRPSIASLPTAVGGDFVTLDAGEHRLRGVRGLTPPASTAPHIFPDGLFEFTIEGVTPGGSATFELTLPSAARPGRYVKWDPATGQVADFSFDGTTGAVFDDNVVTLHLVDGGRGDADGVANGVIVDPGGTSGLPPLVQTFYVPFPEDQLLDSFGAINSKSAGPIQTHISITAAADGTIIVYDHWEDGYEADISNPTQSTTQIWGDGNSANGTAPGTIDDLLTAGDVIVLDNLVDPTSMSTLDFDGGDKFAVTKTVAVTRMAWPTLTSNNGNNGPLFAEGIEVYDVASWGTEFRTPIGENLATSVDRDNFNYSGLMIMAMREGTVVQIDADAIGSYEIQKTLTEGESFLVNGKVNRGARILSSDPIQVALLTGTPGSSYANRWFTMLPMADWSNNYYTPVATTTKSHETAVFVHNPGASSIDVEWRILGGAQTKFEVSAGATVRQTLPENTGARFYTTGGQPFYAVTAVDVESGDVGWAYDWGMTLLPTDRLTHQVLVGLGYGSHPLGEANYNPVWVTPVGNSSKVNVYVDYNGDNVGQYTDPNGFKFDTKLTLSEFESARIYEPDKDQTGLLVYVLDPAVKLAAAWGANP